MLILIGGARRNRTDDLFNAIEALSQLSYGPINSAPPLGGGCGRNAFADGCIVQAARRRNPEQAKGRGCPIQGERHR